MKSILVWARTFPPEFSQGWTIHFIERTRRYWVEAQAGLKNAFRFEKGVKAAWDWASPSEWIRWFTDGERHYGKTLWKLASVYLSPGETPQAYAISESLARRLRSPHEGQRISRNASC